MGRDPMRHKRIHVPSSGSTGARPTARNKKVSRKRPHSPVRLFINIDEAMAMPTLLPTLVFKRRYPSLTFPVPPIRTPLYWFDRNMLDKKLIISVPPDTFVCDGRRFKVIAQDQKYVGRFQFTRWLVYEEAAVPKGERP
jgi:hypothetical protein